MPNESELAIVFAGNTIDADFVRTLLESEGIEVFLHNEAKGVLVPWYVEAAGVGATKVVVRTEDLERAEPIVREFTEDDQS